jgi:hypothetical protein
MPSTDILSSTTSAAIVSSTSNVTQTPRPPFSTSENSRVVNARRLQIVLVMDSKTPKYTKQREMARSDIENVAKSLNVNLKVRHISNRYS